MLVNSIGFHSRKLHKTRSGYGRSPYARALAEQRVWLQANARYAKPITLPRVQWMETTKGKV
jgi:hypothetical protein